MSSGHAPSPGAQKSLSPSAAGHGAPWPVAAVVTLYVLLLQSSRQLDHEPTQLPAGQAPSPGLHCAVLLSKATQSVPFPDCGTLTVYTFSHKESQLEYEPTQSTSGGQAPSPAAHAASLPASSGHSAPVPSAGTVTLYVFVQVSSHSDQLPSQSTAQSAVHEPDSGVLSCICLSSVRVPCRNSHSVSHTSRYKRAGCLKRITSATVRGSESGALILSCLPPDLPCTRVSCARRPQLQNCY